jgi:hypothetical protein
MIMETIAEPLVCRYRWTEQEAWKVARYHWKKGVRWPFRALAYLVLGGILVLSAWSLLTHGFAVSSLVLFLVSIYFILLLRFEARWQHRRKFRRRPDRDALLEYRVSDEGIAFKSEGLGEGQTTWAAVFKVLRVPDGVIVYPHEQVMYWLPHDGFSSAGASVELDRLLRAKVPRYDSL